MFIVIEGTDASGKTSLISAVRDEITRQFPSMPLFEFHKGKPDELTRRWVLQDYVTSIEKQDWFNSIGLSDRWHWGEVTYAPKYRPHTNKDGYGLLGKAGWRWVELFLWSRGVAQFWLYQPLEVIQARLEARGDEFVKVGDLEEVLGYYETAVDNSILADILTPKADSKDSIETLARYVISVAQAIELNAKHLQEFPYYIGNPNPRVLLVGDTRNITKQYGEETTLPFMPVDGNSAEFLLSALPDRLWRDCGIININDPGVRESFIDLWLELNRPKIVVLGRQAEKTLNASILDEDLYTVLPHPQYVRRFFNRTKEEYGEAIARAVEISDYNSKEEVWTLR
jgi:hypothetical protein